MKKSSKYDYTKVEDLVNAYTTVTFLWCSSGVLTYLIDDTTFTFSVPQKDHEGRIFRARDSAMFFLPWIREKLAFVKKHGDEY